MVICVQIKKVMYIILCFILFSFVSCTFNRPIATVHHERIETQMQAVPIGADTIEITLSRDAACCVRSTSGSKNNVLNKRANARQDTARCVPTIRSIASTRGVSVKTTHTDTTQTLRITLKPDTIFVPYVHHIRSDTIVIADPTTKTKMEKTQTANLLLILIIIAIIIIFFDRMTKGHNL